MKTFVEVSWIDGRTLNYDQVSPAIEELSRDTEMELVKANFLVIDSQIKLLFKHQPNIDVYSQVVKAFENANLVEGILFMVDTNLQEQPLD